ncbi:MAG TPA: nicotinate-nucleotide adenylyltransferase [Blastocatellia bacterium]|nr:nicotinate-nucleotide adenylyltransferase [Blastocatellia bacterium]
MGRRVGVYGGTFDPVHRGHLRVAAAVVEAFGLERLLLVPAFVPPHKRRQAISAAYHRYAMIALATMDEPALCGSTIELEAPARPFTIETLHRLGAEDPEARLFFVMGADSFAEVTTWREHERILGGTDVIVAARPGVAVGAGHLAPQLQTRVVDLRGGRRPAPEMLARPRVYLTDYVAEDVSATEIRAAVAAGRPVAGLLPEAVAGYIAKYNLYQKEE